MFTFISITVFMCCPSKSFSYCVALDPSAVAGGVAPPVDVMVNHTRGDQLGLWRRRLSSKQGCVIFHQKKNFQGNSYFSQKNLLRRNLRNRGFVAKP